VAIFIYPKSLAQTQKRFGCVCIALLQRKSAGGADEARRMTVLIGARGIAN